MIISTTARDDWAIFFISFWKSKFLEITTYDASGIIAYVGRSSCLQRRVNRSHERIEKTDSISWLEYPHSDIGFAEAFYIGVCRPYRNKENLDKNNKDEEQGIEDELEISSLIYDMECCKWN